MSAEPALLATTWRGDVPETRIRGHVAVVDASGQVLRSLGDPDVVTPMRSCVKPLQALPFIRDAADAVQATDEELAIACSSHWAEPPHIAAVTSLLTKAGLDEHALACGPQPPANHEADEARVRAGLPLRRIDNNCSGKHAGMLAACVVRHWPVEGYQRRTHPMQRAVQAALEEFLGFSLDQAPCGIDGCGLPTYGAPLRAVARAFAAAQQDPAFRRAQDAMASHPLLVGGTGRFDSDLLQAFGDRVTSKIGGAAIWAACLRPEGPGIVVKLEAGPDGAIPPVAIAVLRGLGVDVSESQALRAAERPPLRNWAGEEVGETRPEPALASL